MFVALVVAALVHRATAAVAASEGSPLPPSQLQVEYLTEPITIDTPNPRFSWACNHEGRGRFQSSYELIVIDGASGNTVWNESRSGNSSLNIPF